MIITDKIYYIFEVSPLTLLQEVDEKEGRVAQNIQRYYGLGATLCQQYAAILYIVDNRLDLAPRK